MQKKKLCEWQTTRCFHKTPSYQEVEESIRQQFYSGEGAIQYVPEALAKQTETC